MIIYGKLDRMQVT